MSFILCTPALAAPISEPAARRIDVFITKMGRQTPQKMQRRRSVKMGSVKKLCCDGGVLWCLELGELGEVRGGKLLDHRIRLQLSVIAPATARVPVHVRAPFTN